MPRHFTGSTERHWSDGNAIAADRYLGQDFGFCTICGCQIGPDDKPQHPAFADLCEECGDEVQARMEER